MNGCRAIVLAAAGAALAGCGATAPMKVDSFEPDSSRGVAAEGQGAREIVVEAEGVAHLGDEDRLADARQRAWEQAVERAVAKGGALHVDARSRIEFGVLAEDSVSHTTVGTLTDVTAVEEGLDGHRYRIRLRGTVRAGDVTGGAPVSAAAPGAGESSGETLTSEETPAGVSTAETISLPAVIVRHHTNGGDLPGKSSVHASPRGAGAEPAPAGVPPEGKSSPFSPTATVCCRRFPDALFVKVAEALRDAPGVSRVERKPAPLGAACFSIEHTTMPSIRSADGPIYGEHRGGALRVASPQPAHCPPSGGVSRGA